MAPAAVALVAGAAPVWAVVGRSTEVPARAYAAIDEFHRLYHAGDYLSIHDAFHPTLQQGLARGDALARLDQVRAKLGRVMDVTYACHTDGSSSSTLRIEYRVTFEGGDAWETYDWRFDGREARLLAYAVETLLQDGMADWEIVLAPPGVRPNATTCTEDEDVHWWEGKPQG